MSDARSVLRDLGAILVIIGVITLFVLAVPLYFHEIKGIVVILVTAAIYSGIGAPLYLAFRKADPTNFKSAMVTATLSWFFISLIGSVPFLLMGYDTTSPLITMDVLSGFFESMAGWTGTGLTMVSRPVLLPYTLQFWRTYIQWVGGVGVIILSLAILARPGVGSYVLYRSEGREQRTHPSIISTVRTIWWIFILYTILGIVTLTIIGMMTPHGMDPWQSLNHAMTALATGGFSVTNDSAISFGTITQLTMVILMILGGIAFAAHYDLLKGRVRKFLSDIQFQAMMMIILVGIIALTIINLNDQNLTYGHNILLSLRDSGFQFVSALTCTGFNSVNIGQWTESAKYIIALAMVFGGAAGSTAGGIKLFRAALLSKGVSWRVKRSISTPRRVFVHKFGGKSLSQEDAMDLINEAAIISFMWLLILSVGIVIIGYVFPQETLGNVLFEVCSAQGNVGLSTGITSMGMSPIAKIMLIINMFIGRLEIIPIIVLIKSMFGIRRNIL